MRIGELAESTAVDVETVRFYEKSGLLPPPARQPNGYRSYGTAHLERLAFIRHCRALDMPLPAVTRLLQFLERPASDCAGINVLVDEQIARVRARACARRNAWCRAHRQAVVSANPCRMAHASRRRPGRHSARTLRNQTGASECVGQGVRRARETRA